VEEHFGLGFWSEQPLENKGVQFTWGQLVAEDLGHRLAEHTDRRSLRGSYIVSWTVSGSCVFELEKDAFICGPGDGCVFAADLKHGALQSLGESSGFIFIHF